MNSQPLINSARHWLDAGLGFFYPPVCQICGENRVGWDEGYVCGQCWLRDGGIRFIKPPFCDRCGLPFQGDITNDFKCSNCRDMKLHFSFARSAVVARGLVLEIIHRYKYNRALWFEPFLADLLFRQARRELHRDACDLLVPVPLHPVKEREREFNQAHRIARALSNSTGIPINARLIRRVQPTRTQTLLNRQERAKNVRKAFALRGSIKLNGQRVVLIDDVFTTGATTNACAAILRKAGAKDVCVWTVARGL